ALGPRLERAHLLDGGEVEVLAPDERDQPAQAVFADRPVSGDGERLEQGESFPSRALRLVIDLERAQRVHDRSAAPLRTEVEIDAEDEWVGADRARHFLGEAGIEREVIDDLRPLGTAVAVVDVEEVDVAGEVQLGPPELSHPQDAEAARARRRPALRRAVLRAQPYIMESHRRLENGGGKPAQLARRGGRGDRGER